MEDIWTRLVCTIGNHLDCSHFLLLREIDRSNDLGSRLSVRAGNSHSKNAIGLRMPFKRSVAREEYDMMCWSCEEQLCVSGLAPGQDKDLPLNRPRHAHI